MIHHSSSVTDIWRNYEDYNYRMWKVGSALAEELTMENHEVAIVDISAQKLQEVGEDLDALQVHGNGSSINVLMDAGVTSADLVIAVTGSDELNLLCCLVAKIWENVIQLPG